MVTGEIAFKRGDRTCSSLSQICDEGFVFRRGHHPSPVKYFRSARQRWCRAKLSRLEVFHGENRNLETESADGLYLRHELLVGLSGSQRIARIEQVHIASNPQPEFLELLQS